MKKNNNLIKLTNLSTGEVHYFTKDSYVIRTIGCSQLAMPTIKFNRSPKYSSEWKYEIIDGGDLLYKNINV